jgi:hypothetical protein
MCVSAFDRPEREAFMTTITVLLRRTTSTCLAVFGLAALGLLPAAAASAAPTFTYKTTAYPIPGFPGTGDILGAHALFQLEGKISGTEYGGFPPPLIGVKYYGPAGAMLSPQGFATCAPSTIEQSGPGLCPKRSIAGPQGFGVGVVSFGTERVQERASIQPFFAPGGKLEFFIDGKTPVSLELLSMGHVVESPPPYGATVIGEVPLVETVPGALDASSEEATIRVGAAYKRGKKTISYLTVPKTCPPGGLPTKVELSFLGGATAEASYKMPCPRHSA